MISAPPPIVRAASAIAGQPVRVGCVRNFAYEGQTLPGPIIFLDQQVCANLRLFLAGRATGETVDAVLTLTHEAVHASGVDPETPAECIAYAKAPLVVKMLGGRVTRAVRVSLALAHALTRGNPGYANYRC